MPLWVEIQESAAASCGHCTLIRNSIGESRAHKSDQHCDPPPCGTCFVTVLFDLAGAYKKGPQISITVRTDLGLWTSEMSIYAEPGMHTSSIAETLIDQYVAILDGPAAQYIMLEMTFGIWMITQAMSLP